ncbi:MAG: hypothetical protein IKE63_03435 [Bacilli bacterium]|nr:hypothetical protein [Bacilli bacterium]
MFDKNQLLKGTKGKVAISGVIVTLVLSGCSFQLSAKSDVNDKVLIENTRNYDTELSHAKIDDIMGFSKDSDNLKSYLDYHYLIENNDITGATFAHIVEEKTITNDRKRFDGKKEVDDTILDDSIIQPIVLPKVFVLFNAEKVSDLIDAYADCDITAQKLLTFDGDILYYFESTITFNKFAEKYIGLDIKEGDTMTGKALYKLGVAGNWDLLYRNQEGFRSDDSNVVENNYNDTFDVILPISETIFADMNGKYKEEEIKEILDTYNYTGDYTSQVNTISASKCKKYDG